MTAPSKTAPSPPAKASFLDGGRLSFIAAFVDACGYIGLFQIFSAHITGNFVVIGSQLVHRQGDVVIKIAALPTFVAGVALAYLMARLVGGRAGHMVSLALFGEAALLSLAALLAVAAPAGASDIDPYMAGAALTLVLAMGLQNGMQRIGLAGLPPTTVMTSNVTQAAVDTLVLVFNRKGSEVDAAGLSVAQSRERLKRLAPHVIGFGLGATAGAIGIGWLGFYSLFLAALFCVEMALQYLLGRRLGSPA